ncbi:MAG TPA: helix-turn-helix domain-containing protein [Candidatus Baltobacteraceae bacterium]|nr:helix-turn-helix domain-containing protein [Candidatus Baltobacteraceae bacterium]
MRHASLAAQPCPIARTLDLVGEWWTLLIVRDALQGARRFDEFKSTGIADNVLSARLKKLTEAGILKRKRYQTHPDRYEYLLTEKGSELAPVVLALRSWGKRFTKGPDTSRIIHQTCGGSIEPSFHCTKCDREIDGAEVTAARLDAS